MKLVAIAMVKDEADVIERTLWHVAQQGADEIIVADNLSTDGTGELLSALADDLPLTVLSDEEVGYYQSRKTTELARVALRDGADWVWPFDADELWTWPAGRVRDALDENAGLRLVGGYLYDHYATMIDPAGHPFDSMQWRRAEPLGLAKIIARAEPGLVIEAGNHGARMAGNPEVVDLGLIVHHYPYRGADHFVRKAKNGAAAYAETDLPSWIGEHWRNYGAMIDEHGDAAARAWYEEHFTYDDPLAAGLVLDPAGVPDVIPPAYDPGA